MTDKEKALELLRSFGYTEGQSDWEAALLLSHNQYMLDPLEVCGLRRSRIVLSLFNRELDLGGFISFEFSSDGKFMEHVYME